MLVRKPESELLIALFREGLAAALPDRCLPLYLPTEPSKGTTLVLGAGKAAAGMAATLAACYLERGLGPLSGLVVTRYGHGLPGPESLSGIKILEAGHPVPDEASVTAGSHTLRLARQCGRDDRCIVLLSGGASALLVQPVAGISLADKQALNRQLLDSGAGIDEINTVRCQLSTIKGGGLARQTGTTDLWLFAISDVPGDGVATIGSGPVSLNPSSRADARGILARYRISPEPAVARALKDLPAGEEAATPGGREGGVSPTQSRIIASSKTAVAATARAAEAAGWKPLVLPEVDGGAQDTAREHATLIRNLRQSRQRVALISGGETRVRVVRADGRGGRNGEYLLALALALGQNQGIYALAADTDGIDGTGDNAGALLSPDTLSRAARAGQDPVAQLAGQRSYPFFAALGDLLMTGPTGTNVNDLRIALVA